MTERLGDMPLDERLMEGADLLNFIPEDYERSHLRNTLSGERRQTPGQRDAAMRREGQYMKGYSRGDDVVSTLIYLDDADDEGKVTRREWNYHFSDGINSIHRCFIEKDQALELHIDRTLMQLSATDKADVKTLIESENTDQNNQYIMQLMYDRVKRGLPMLMFRYSPSK